MVRKNRESTTGARALIVRGPISLSDALSGALFDAGAGGVEVRERGREVELVVYCDASDASVLAAAIRGSLGDLARRNAKAKKVTLSVEDLPDEWKTAWVETLRPVRLTESFIVCPGSTRPLDSTRRIVRLEPGLVFGYGEHPTTRLAAARVESFCARHPGCTVLDLGTGSGVLAIVAAMSGANRVVGLDSDEDAVRAARSNAETNGVAFCHFSNEPLAQLSEQFDCAVANVDRTTLVRLRDDVARVTAPGASLFLTGFLGEDIPSIEESYRAAFDCIEREEDEPWVLLEFRRRR